MSFYLIQRQPRPPHHNAPYHPVCICDRKDIAIDVQGDSTDYATVWVNDQPTYYGWLMTRWKGLVIDYGHLVRPVILPDNSNAAFWHGEEPHKFMQGAIWWSRNIMPQWAIDFGVLYPPDHFTQQRILDTYAEVEFEKSMRSQKDTTQIGFCVTGSGTRECPAFWPKIEVPRRS